MGIKNIQKKIERDTLPKHLDKSFSIKERKLAFKEVINLQMNPFDNFDPSNFEPLASEEEKEVLDRVRKIPPKELPTFGIKPKSVREGQMIGMYESKQDLYLIFAHRCNDLQAQVDLLLKEIKKLKGE